MGEFMRTQPRFLILLVFAAVIVTSLACTLGGGAEPTPTTVSQVTLVPTREPPTPTQIVLTLVVPPTETTTPPTNTPSPTATPIVGTGPGGCVLKGTYVADVTIPDGTVLAPNAPFVKTWRIRNDGTCTWDAGYQLIYASGNQMSGPAAVGIPAAAPGQTIDISVNLVAPGTAGEYTGVWRLRASNNAIFGGYTVVIRVAGPPTPTATPAGGPWSGTWLTSYGQMTLVQTGSQVVGTYDNNFGTINGTVTGNRLSGTWAETSGANGSFDFWIEGSGLRWHGNFNKTTQWCGHRAGQSDLSPCGVSTWYGTWTTNCDSGACGDMTLTQVGDSVNGTYAGGGGSITGTVNGTELTGTWTRSGTSGLFKFFMMSNGQQFQGNFNTSFGWCGFRSGSSLPSPCLKN
jgi:hypothetical protein